MCMDAWVAADIVHRAGWASSLRLQAACRAARGSLHVILPYVRSLLPYKICCPCDDARVAEFDFSRGTWVVHGRPLHRELFCVRSLLHVNGQLLAVTRKGALHTFDPACGSWDPSPLMALGPELGCWVVVADGRQLYLLETDFSGCVRIKKVDLVAQKSEQLWLGRPMGDALADLGDLRPVVLNDTLFWFGLDRAEAALLVFAVDVRTGQLRTAPPLKDPRIGRMYCDHKQVAVLSGCLYVIAHCERDAKWFHSPTALLVWRLRVDAGVWDLLPPVPTVRAHFGVAALGGKLYVVGGESPKSAEVLGDVERLDPVACTWEEVPPMPTGRSDPVLVPHGGRLCVLGGSGDCYGDASDQPWPSRTFEGFDPYSGSWLQMPALPEELSGTDLRCTKPAVLE